MTDHSATKELRLGWPLILTANLGLSLQTLASYSLGLMMDPLGDEFGWSRAQISMASLIPALLMITLSPFVGAIIDRWGTRRLAIPSIALTGISLAMISLVNGSLILWFALWFFYGLVSLGTKITVWTTAISGSFSAARGMALGLAVAGAAVTQIVAPPLTQFLVDGYGWRTAYVWLGIGWAALPFVLALFFLRDARDRQRLANKPDTPPQPAPVPLTGLSGREALRNVPLLRIAISTLLTMFIGTAILIHQVPILTSAGIDRSDAAWFAGLAGVAALIGKIMTGWMVDRWDASLVGACFLLAPALGYWFILNDAHNFVAILMGMVIIGYTTGAKIQVCAYLTAQHAGMRNYGKIFGVMTSMIGIGGGLGSIVAGLVFDQFGHYEPILVVGILLSFVCSGLILKLGQAPDWRVQAVSSSAT